MKTLKTKCDTKRNSTWLLAGLTFIGFLLPSMSLEAGRTWRRRADMPSAREDLSTSVVLNKIYAIGGWTRAPNRVGFSTVEEYDPTTDTWTTKADMPTKRLALSSAVVNNKIYVIGGTKDFSRVLPTVEEYNPVQDTWTTKADMPTARYFFSTSVVDGKIYVIGGAVLVGGVVEVISTVEEYDPVKDVWTKKASMPTARWCSTAAVNGKIYAIGGWRRERGIDKALKMVEIYDPAANTWTKGADVPTARWSHSTSVVGGRIYAIGGTILNPLQESVTVKKVEIYNPATGRWTKERDMPMPRGWLSTSAVSGKIYAIGGAAARLPDAVLSTVEEFDTGYAVNATDKLPTTWGEIKHRR